MENIKTEAENNLMSDANDFIMKNGYPDSQDLDCSQLLSSQLSLSHEVPTIAEEVKENMKESITDDEFTAIKVCTKSDTNYPLTIPSPVVHLEADSNASSDLGSEETSRAVTAVFSKAVKSSSLFSSLTTPSPERKNSNSHRGRLVRTYEERRERRKDSNRRAAERSRLKKRAAEQQKEENFQNILDEKEQLYARIAEQKVAIANLQAVNASLLTTNSSLQDRVDLLSAENRQLSSAKRCMRCSKQL